IHSFPTRRSSDLGNVAVTQAGNVYTVAFKGTLAGTIQPLMTATSSAGGTALVGTGLGNTSLGAPLAPLSLWSSNNSVWSPGVTLFQTSPYLQALAPAGSDTIVPSDSGWHGPVTLNTSTPIDVSPGSRLTIDGVIDD